MKLLQKKGYAVVGVSGDSVEGQAIFKKVHKFEYPLLADSKGEVAKAFGVPTRKGGSIDFEVEGKKVTLTRGVTPARWTFAIGKDGKIVYKDTKVRAAQDSKAVLEALEGSEK